MSEDVSLYVLYQIVNAPIRMFPFPHVYVENVFPPDYYREMRDLLPSTETFGTLKALGRVADDYSESRLVLPLAPKDLERAAGPMREFWGDLSNWMLGGNFGRLMVAKFGEIVQQRLGDLGRMRFHDEALLVRDHASYALGPHTDSPTKALSFLFYLPPDDSQPHLGTSLYVPRDPEFACTGGPHYPFESFRRVCTLPYLPNTLLAFPKGPRSFHGVERLVDTAVRRDLLLYDVKIENPPELAQQPSESIQAGALPRFSF